MLYVFLWLEAMNFKCLFLCRFTLFFNARFFYFFLLAVKEAHHQVQIIPLALVHQIRHLHHKIHLYDPLVH